MDRHLPFLPFKFVTYRTSKRDPAAPVVCMIACVMYLWIDLYFKNFVMTFVTATMMAHAIATWYMSDGFVMRSHAL